MRISGARIVYVSLAVILAFVAAFSISPFGDQGAIEGLRIAADEQNRIKTETPTEKIYAGDESVDHMLANNEALSVGRHTNLETVLGEIVLEPDDAVRRNAESLYKIADRISYVTIDAAEFISRLSYSRAYQYSASGNFPAKIEDTVTSDLLIRVFDDKTYALAVTEVDIIGSPDPRTLIVRGRVLGIEQSVFRISSKSAGTMISGYIDTPEFFTRIDTWSNSPTTAVGEFSRSTVERHAEPTHRVY